MGAAAWIAMCMCAASSQLFAVIARNSCRAANIWCPLTLSGVGRLKDGSILCLIKQQLRVAAALARQFKCVFARGDGQ